MGRTVPSFRTVLATEKEDWKPFLNALDKSDRKKFDEMWDLPRWYISACSNSVQYVRLHPILMSDEYYNNEKTDISKEYCTNEFCGRKLIYSDKIGKMFCPECFYHLTEEEEGSGGKTVVRQLSRVERIREKRRALEFPGLDDDLRRTVSKVGGTIVKT